jgi:hypothetical protein
MVRGHDGVYQFEGVGILFPVLQEFCIRQEPTLRLFDPAFHFVCGGADTEPLFTFRVLNFKHFSEKKLGVQFAMVGGEPTDGDNAERANPKWHAQKTVRERCYSIEQGQM